jgi:hypothetical protein
MLLTILGWIVFGLIVGFIARALVPGKDDIGIGQRGVRADPAPLLRARPETPDLSSDRGAPPPGLSVLCVLRV